MSFLLNSWISKEKKEKFNFFTNEVLLKIDTSVLFSTLPLLYESVMMTVTEVQDKFYYLSKLKNFTLPCHLMILLKKGIGEARAI